MPTGKILLPLFSLLNTHFNIYVIIPLFAGLILSAGGFLSFMVTGSIAAIRFGVILGGVLLALSISSLKAYKKGQPSPLALKGQTGLKFKILFICLFVNRKAYFVLLVILQQ